MVKHCYFSVILVLLFSFVSCSKEATDNNGNLDSSYQEDFALFLSEVEGLNKDFGYYQTRGGLGDEFIKRSADLAGAKLGAWAGSQLGAGLGVLTANPVVGVVGYLGGRKVGGVAGWCVCSYIAEVLLESIKDSSSGYYVHDIQYYMDLYDEFCLLQVDFSDNNSCGIKDYSIGDIHNMILAKLIQNGKQYLDNAGHINIDELYDDAVQIERGILNDDLSSNPEYRRLFIAFCKDVEIAAREMYLYNEDGDSYNARLFQSLINLGIPAVEVQQLEELTELLKAPAVLDQERTIAYERAFEQIVESSTLPEEKKVDFINSGSVAIMSAEFWKHIQRSN